jgi:exopolysaccharide biosynthesis polyprenyl glycosylphosphotransferase
MLGIIIALFLLRLQPARSVIILMTVLGFSLILLKEELLRKVYLTKFGQAQFKRRVILAGTPREREEMHALLRGIPMDQITIVEEFDLESRSVAELIECLHRHSANIVVFNARFTQFAQVELALQACEHEGVESLLVADFFRTKIFNLGFDHFFGFPVLVYSAVPVKDWRAVVKHGIDFAGAVLLLLLASPLLVLAALAVKLLSPGPVLFRQQRAGLNGHPFTMFKFRSMAVDAEARKQDLAGQNEMSGPVFKVSNDPRVTPIGRILRRYSIDELPQLFNVLRGEMSLVGPRPLPLEEVRRFEQSAHRRRLSVKPGLTCLWQISGRNKITNFQEWVRLDLQYIDNWSLWLDFKILCLTGPAVLFGRGAK